MKKMIFSLLFMLLSLAIMGQMLPDTLWTRTIDREMMVNELFSVVQDSDGNFVVAGNTENYGSDDYRDLWIMKYSANGNLIWEKKFLEDNSYEIGGYLANLSDGFVIGGTTDNDENSSSILIKIDNNGNYVWSYIHNMSNQNISLRSIAGLCDNSGIVSAGWFGDEYNNESQAFLFEVNPNGTLEWFQGYDFGNPNDDYNKKIFSVIQTLDHGFIASGDYLQYDENYNYQSDIFVIKTDNLGNEEWHKIYSLAHNSFSTSIKQTSQGDYLITGYTIEDDNTESNAIFLMKIDENGDIIWQREYRNDGFDDKAYDLEVLSDGTYAISGYIQNDHAIIIKTDELGYLEWEKILYNGNKKLYDILETNDHGIIAVGTCWDNSSEDAYMLRLGIVANNQLNTLPQSTLLLQQNYPNPFNPETNINFTIARNNVYTTFDIFNLKGQKVKRILGKKIKAGNYTVTWNGKDELGRKVADGVYFYKISTPDNSTIKKMVLLK